MRLLPKKLRAVCFAGGSALAIFALSVAAEAAVTTPMAPPRVVAAPYAGYVNHAHVTPAFHWGWFGAERYHQRVDWHRDYNGEVIRWSRQRRY